MWKRTAGCAQASLLLSGRRTFSSSTVMRRKSEVDVIGETVGMRTNVKDLSGKQRMILDEPAKIGGTDLGPTPLEGLLGCLAGCENATARGVAKKMKLNVTGLAFKVHGEWDNAAFLGTADAPPTHFQKIDLNVEVNSPDVISDESLKKLQETTENLCPVASLIRAAGVQVKSTWTFKKV